MLPSSFKLILEIIVGLFANILISYLILPQFVRVRARYYNLNDFYLSVYVGLIISAVQLVIIFFGVWILMD